MPATAFAGDIAGLLPSLPPLTDSRFQFSLSNDFLGRGGSVDDFRTQQFIIGADIGASWTMVLDHSVLTLTDPQSPGRVDQRSVGIGYHWIDSRTASLASRITTGLGVRDVGDFAGERMQNGFHRLIGSDTEDLPYSASDETMATAWIDAERYRRLYETTGGWGFGYWLRGNALVTSDGQLDGSLSGLAVASRNGFDAWVGLRQDWRGGYEETVQRATAAAEEDLAVTVGVRFGTLVLETVQQFDNAASFGQLRLLSLQSEASRSAGHQSRFGIEFGFLMPDVHLHVAGRMRSSILTNDGSVWRESIVISADIGEPQFGDDATIYIDSTQVATSIEWERPLAASNDWLGFYTSAGLGWREERLLGDGALLGMKSTSASSLTVVTSAGLRFNAAALGDNWHYRIQLGATAWLPTDSAGLSINGSQYSVLESTAALSLGVSFEFH